MKKDLGIQQAVYPMPVLMIATYDENGVVDENGKVDPAKLNAFCFDNFQSGYYDLGGKVGQAWKNGMKFMDK